MYKAVSNFVLLVSLWFISFPLLAQSDSSSLGFELNKLEQSTDDCLAFLVLKNSAQMHFDILKVDLVLFDTQGLIQRRLALNVAPVEPEKTRVRQFRMAGVQCGDIGSILVNEVIECVVDGSPNTSCLGLMSISSRLNISLYK